MKIRILALLVLGLVIALCGQQAANASITTIRVQAGDSVLLMPGSHQYSTNGETGGEFAMTVWDGAGKLKGTFYTFCADPKTSMQYNTVYHVNGVANANASGYQLSDYGKWIYYQYAKNDNGDVTASYIPGHTTTTTQPIVAGGALFNDEVAGAIQEGIWWELLKTDGAHDWPANWNRDAYFAVSGPQNWYSHYQDRDDAGFEANRNSIGIAQLTLGLAGVQNQMVFTVVGGSSGGPVPEPATLIVWSLLGAASWLGMRVWRRCGGPAGRQPWSPENRQAIHDIIAHGAPR